MDVKGDKSSYKFLTKVS